MTRTERRFHRQFEALSRLIPQLRGPLTALRRDHWRLVRIPLALLMIAGGLLWFLPVLGLWMLPFGLLLLAVDLPILRAPISNLVIRGRRRVKIWLARLRSKAKT
ncbi:MAG: hypothetical protein ACRC14_19340 [Paracoccaceae bacterium]